ncbi:tetratricopeptide repeat protein [Adhaeribacter sp. BT258]|uniref:Tetratricopeptide repeat protein n=1 Tax=Adhaeribacter terrigena TaxID=2793070 RepID=A0ABS1C3U3_9BACT|nr:tetratricopeptide repeat protein [Adhaeribacter terrigena]MBK0404027.1 tetratricopeptide repeat protein [Adhaeribacter terrigena]
MLRIFLFLILNAISVNVFAQSKADSLFMSGGEAFELENYSEAIKNFKELVRNYKGFEYYNQAVYNLAYTYDASDSLDQAILWYEKIRSSNVKDNSRVGGRGIFEPYANYKHFSTSNIASIEYNRGNYEKALDYYTQSLNKFPYFNSSGTDLRINENRLKIYLVDCLKKLKRFDEALDIIVLQALASKGSSNYQSVVKSAIVLINENFDKNKIASEIENSLTTIKRKGTGSFELNWRNKKTTIHPYSAGQNLTVAKLKDEIKQSLFWTELTKP